MKKILFLLSHQPNPRFVKQINFLSNENQVSVVYYFREYIKDLSSEYNDKVVLNKNLGSITNGNYIKRIIKYLKSFLKLKNILKLNTYDILVVNNIDTLALFKLSFIFQKIDTKLIMEISDLRSHTYTNNYKSKVMRIIESNLFNYIDKLIITSPKFYDEYYKKIFKNEPFILENKPLRNMIPQKLNHEKRDKIVIGIVGLLLQGRPYETLFETLKNDERYEVHIYGKGTYQSMVEEYSNKYKHIKYFGEYNFFQDSANIYASLDILYMPYDTTNGSLNNKVALPNKLYEAMYFQVPIITSKASYLGELVNKYGIGMTIKCCDKENLLETLANIDFDNINLKFNNLSEDIYFGDKDYKKLSSYLYD